MTTTNMSIALNVQKLNETKDLSDTSLKTMVTWYNQLADGILGMETKKRFATKTAGLKALNGIIKTAEAKGILNFHGDPSVNEAIEADKKAKKAKKSGTGATTERAVLLIILDGGKPKKRAEVKRSDLTKAKAITLNTKPSQRRWDKYFAKHEAKISVNADAFKGE